MRTILSSVRTVVLRFGAERKQPIFFRGVRRAVLQAAAVWTAIAGLAAAQSTTVVISQVYGAGGNAGAVLNADYVELLNISSSPVSLSGMSLQYASATGAFNAGSHVLALSGTIPPGGYFLVGMVPGTNGSALPPTDQTGSLSLAASNGKVALVNGTDALGTLVLPNEAVIDFVGFGTATLFEGGGAAAAPNTTLAIFRQNDGSLDTDNNASDFFAAAPAPRNSSSPSWGGVGEDTTPPEIAILNPANETVGVASGTTFSVTFNEPVFAGTGNVSLHAEGGGLVQALPAASAVIDGSTASFTFTSTLDENAYYYILIDAGTFVDGSDNAYEGLADPSIWSFRAAGPDIFAPEPVSFFPADGAVNVPLGVLVSFTEDVANVVFDEPVLAGTGQVRLVRVSDNQVLETLNVANDEEVWLVEADKPMFFFTTSPLDYETAYRIEVDAGAFTDGANPSAAFSWTFTTVPEPPSVPLTLDGPYTQDFSTFGPVEESTVPELPLGWSLRGLVTTFNTNAAHRAWGEGFNNGLRGIVGENVLGYQHTGSTVSSASPTFDKILTLRNTTGAPITNLSISYDGKGHRLDQGRSPAYAVTVDGVSVPGLTFSLGPYGPPATDVTANVASSVSGLNIPDGAIFQIIWSSDRGTGSEASKQIGLSNVSVSVGSSVLPPAIVGPSLNLGDLTHVSASSAAEITSDNGSAVTERGFVYALTSANPTPELGGEGVTVVEAGAGTGVFSSPLSGLSPSTSYTIRAYATNGIGTNYTSASTFLTLPAPPAFAGIYTQPFDAFAGGWPVGWSLVSSGGAQGFQGNWTSGAFNGGFYGNESDPGVMGYLPTNASPEVTARLTLVNQTAAPITQLFISYLGRVHLVNDHPRNSTWTVSIDGEPVAALAYSTEEGTDQSLSALVTGLNIPVGAEFTIAWVSERLGASGNSRRIGLGEVVVALEEPEPGEGGFSDWAAANAGGGEFDEDFDNDGIPNGLEYFFGETGSLFTPNPAVVDGTITWPRDPSVTDVTFVVQTSTTLAEGSWVDVPAGELDLSAESISYTLPAPVPGEPRLFVRIVATQAP